MDASSPQPARFDPRIVGAVLALSLDLAGVALGIVGANAPHLVGTYLLVAALPGLIVGPLVGWRYGRAAAMREPFGTWVPRAVATAVSVGLGLWFVYDLAAVLVLGSPGGPGSLPWFLVFAAFETTIFALGATLFIVLPLGVIWVGFMRLVGRRLDLLGTSS